MMLFAFSEAFWQNFSTVLTGAVVAIILAFIQNLNARAERREMREEAAKAREEMRLAAREAAIEVKEVKVTLKETTSDNKTQVREVRAKLDEATIKTDSKLDAIHTLVNNQHGVALASVASLARWKAGQTNSKEDMDAADYAEKKLRDHEGKQAVVDARVALEK